MRRNNIKYDCFGAEINEGDLIAYPVRRGSNMWMSYGKILSISEWSLQLEIEDVNNIKRKIRFYNLNRCVKICK